MKLTLPLLISACSFFLLPSALRCEEAKTAEQMEAEFTETMTAATLTGYWRPLQDGRLAPEKEDKYQIAKVEKTGGDRWVIHARMTFGQQELVVPIPVQVRWAGDSAVIIVDHLSIPGSGASGTSYSAHLLVHDHTYAGSWSGGDHGGLMSGLITHEKAAR